MNKKTGPMAQVATLICKKTKMKKEDVFDVLELLPEAIMETFFSMNPPEKEPVSFGFLRLSHTNSKSDFNYINLSKSPSFRQVITKQRNKYFANLPQTDANASNFAQPKSKALPRHKYDKSEE